MQTIGTARSLRRTDAARIIVSINKVWNRRPDIQNLSRQNRSSRQLFKKIQPLMQEVIDLYQIAISVGKAKIALAEAKKARSLARISKKDSKNSKHVKFSKGNSSPITHITNLCVCMICSYLFISGRYPGSENWMNRYIKCGHVSLNQLQSEQEVAIINENKNAEFKVCAIADY